MIGVHLAVALVNRADRSDVAELELMLREHWIRTEALSGSECVELAGLAARLRLVFEARQLDARCTAVNELLAGRGSAFLSVHDDLPPHLHFAPNDDDVVSRARAFTAGSLAMFLVEAAGERLGSCARQACGMVFVDTSRGGRRRYCSTRCANYDAVGRHRERTGAGSTHD